MDLDRKFVLTCWEDFVDNDWLLSFELPKEPDKFVTSFSSELLFFSFNTFEIPLPRFRIDNEEEDDDDDGDSDFILLPPLLLKALAFFDLPFSRFRDGTEDDDEGIDKNEGTVDDGYSDLFAIFILLFDFIDLPFARFSDDDNDDDGDSSLAAGFVLDLPPADSLPLETIDIEKDRELLREEVPSIKEPTPSISFRGGEKSRGGGTHIS